MYADFAFELPEYPVCGICQDEAEEAAEIGCFESEPEYAVPGYGD